MPGRTRRQTVRKEPESLAYLTAEPAGDGPLMKVRLREAEAPAQQFIQSAAAKSSRSAE